MRVERERKVSCIVVTEEEERDFIEAIIDMAKTIKPNVDAEDDEMIRTIGSIVRELYVYDEARVGEF